jgi:cytoskeleton protein RodZ
MPEIGQSLREARMRARIDVSEIEGKTKIRAKYLRALENEEWGLLPGPTFVKSFLRTYAQALGLDAKALVEEYRLHHESPSEPQLEPIVPAPRRERGPGIARGGGGGGGPSRAYMVLVGFVVLLIVLLIVGLLDTGGSSKSTRTGSSARKPAAARHAGSAVRGGAAGTGTSPQPARVALSLHATGTVYVCLIGDGGRRLLSGTTLQPGASTPTYHARRFEITLGNNAVTMVLDGTPRTVPASSKAIGYSITKAGRRTLPAERQPTCT